MQQDCRSAPQAATKRPSGVPRETRRGCSCLGGRSSARGCAGSWRAQMSPPPDRLPSTPNILYRTLRRHQTGTPKLCGPALTCHRTARRAVPVIGFRPSVHTVPARLLTRSRAAAPSPPPLGCMFQLSRCHTVCHKTGSAVHRPRACWEPGNCPPWARPHGMEAGIRRATRRRGGANEPRASPPAAERHAPFRSNTARAAFQRTAPRAQAAPAHPAARRERPVRRPASSSPATTHRPLRAPELGQHGRRQRLWRLWRRGGDVIHGGRRSVTPPVAPTATRTRAPHRLQTARTPGGREARTPRRREAGTPENRRSCCSGQAQPQGQPRARVILSSQHVTLI